MSLASEYRYILNMTTGVVDCNPDGTVRDYGSAELARKIAADRTAEGTDIVWAVTYDSAVKASIKYAKGEWVEPKSVREAHERPIYINTDMRRPYKR